MTPGRNIAGKRRRLQHFPRKSGRLIFGRGSDVVQFTAMAPPRRAYHSHSHDMFCGCVLCAGLMAVPLVPTSMGLLSANRLR
jgi:hypothetical protein